MKLWRHHQSRAPGLHKMDEERIPNGHVRSPGASKTIKFPRKDTQRRGKIANICGRQNKKSGMLGGPGKAVVSAQCSPNLPSSATPDIPWTSVPDHSPWTALPLDFPKWRMVDPILFFVICCSCVLGFFFCRMCFSVFLLFLFVFLCFSCFPLIFSSVVWTNTQCD